jgi:hypothetical protein
MAFNIIDWLFPEKSHYTFVAEEKHLKYGLHPGATYRAPQEWDDGAGHYRTTGRPMLVHDPAYGPVTNWRHMLPWTSVPEEFVVQNEDGTTSTLKNPAYKTVAYLDLAIGIFLILAVAAIIIAIVTAP